jgi:hypothetical protein
MQRIRHNDLVYYQFDSLSESDFLTHGVFTRRGGVSPAPFDSLNVASSVGDAIKNVQTNRQHMAAALGVGEERTRTVWQVHSADVIVARRDAPQGDTPPQADGIITDEPGLPLVMRFADCVPIMLHDPVHGAIGIAHAGWRGTVAGIAGAVVQAMVDAYDTRPQDLIAAIGPSIGPCCYEVGPEVVAQVRGAFLDSSGLILPPANGGGPHLDLWAANQRALEVSGVERVEVARLCTACHTHEFYSYRAEAGRTGRFGALISLRRGGPR